MPLNILCLSERKQSFILYCHVALICMVKGQKSRKYETIIKKVLCPLNTPLCALEIKRDKRFVFFFVCRLLIRISSNKSIDNWKMIKCK